MQGSVHALEQPRNRCRKWQLRVCVGKDPKTDRYRRRTRTVTGGYRDAQSALRGFIAELERAETPSEDMPLVDYVARYMEHFEECGKYAPRTIDARRNRLKAVTVNIGNMKLRDIKPSTLEKLYAALRSGKGTSGRQLSGTTVTDVHTALYAVFKQAQRDGIIRINPCDGIDRPKYDTPEKNAIPMKDVEILLERLDASKNTDLAALLCIKTGMRRGEVLALEWDDIDFTAGIIYVRRSLDEDGKDRPTKTRAGHRMLPLSDSVRADLARIAHTGRKVVSKNNGTPLLPHSFTTWWRRNRDRLGVPGSTIHELRHTYLSMLAASGVNPKVMQELAGHSNIQTTMKIYTHVDMEQKRRAAAVMDDVFGTMDKNEQPCDCSEIVPRYIHSENNIIKHIPSDLL